MGRTARAGIEPKTSKSIPNSSFTNRPSHITQLLQLFILLRPSHPFRQFRRNCLRQIGSLPPSPSQGKEHFLYPNIQKPYALHHTNICIQGSFRIAGRSHEKNNQDISERSLRSNTVFLIQFSVVRNSCYINSGQQFATSFKFEGI